MSYGGKDKRGASEVEYSKGGSRDREVERSTESKYDRLYEDELDPFKEFDCRKFGSARWFIYLAMKSLRS